MLRVVNVGMLALLVVAGAMADTGSSGPPRVSIVRVPDGGIQPQAAVDGNATVHIVYFKGDPAHGDLFYARVGPDGRVSSAVRVNSQAESAIATGNVRGGRIAIGRNGRVHVAWMGSSNTHAARDPAPVFYARLGVDGTRFEDQQNLLRQPAVGPDGASVAADAAGHVYVFWHALPDGGAGEADRRLWLASSGDEGRTFAAERPVSDPAMGACACCGTGALASADGRLYSLFRAARDGVHRDTILMTSLDGGATFGATDLHRWDINACPMSTYAFGHREADPRVVAAWETDGRVFWTNVGSGMRAALVQAGGDVKNQKHPSVAVNRRGQVLVAWTEGMGWSKGGSAAWQVFDERGDPLGARGSATGVPAWSLVAVYSRPDGTFSIVY
jgi:hypothetical protein